MESKKIIDLFLMFILTLSVSKLHSQTEFSGWDEKYRSIDITSVVEFEMSYADSVKNGLIDKPDIYVRFDTYRYIAKYLGVIEKTPVSDIETMVFVCDNYGLDTSIVRLASSSPLFEIGGKTYRFPIQDVLLQDFESEVEKGDSITLYCAFFNLYKDGVLKNVFLISEFHG